MMVAKKPVKGNMGGGFKISNSGPNTPSPSLTNSSSNAFAQSPIGFNIQGQPQEKPKKPKQRAQDDLATIQRNVEPSPFLTKDPNAFVFTTPQVSNNPFLDILNPGGQQNMFATTLQPQFQNLAVTQPNYLSNSPQANPFATTAQPIQLQAQFQQSPTQPVNPFATSTQPSFQPIQPIVQQPSFQPTIQPVVQQPSFQPTIQPVPQPSFQPTVGQSNPFATSTQPTFQSSPTTNPFATNQPPMY